MNHHRACTAALLVLLLCAAPLPAAEKPAAAKSGDEPAVELDVRSWEELQKLVASHKGKVVVVDVWTTTCGICVAEFPKFAAMTKQFPAESVALISVNCDYDGIEGKPPAFYRAGVLKFLKQHKATFDNVMLDVAFIDFLDKIDLASTPAVLVYGRDGKLARRFDNDDAEKVEDEFTIKDVRQYVGKLLSAAAK